MRNATLLFALTIAVSCASDPGTAEDEPQLAGPCEACTNDRDCGEGMLCDERWGIWACKTPDVYDNSGPSKPLCETDCHVVCVEQGSCHLIDGRCQPTSDADCKASAACTNPSGGAFCAFWPATEDRIATCGKAP